MQQASFADLAYTHKKKIARKERFLTEMGQLLPWPQWLKPILKRYPKPGQGRRPIPAEVWVRIYFLHQGYGLSDPAMEDSLYDSEAMRRFAQVDLAPMPDETTLCQFRHFLEAHELTAALFRLTTQYWAERAVLVQTGTIVEATILAASGSTKNQAQARDPEMASTKKGRNWYFGLKAHIGSDPQGRVQRVVVTDASVHDSQMLADCCHGAEPVIYGDQAYASAAAQQTAEAQGQTWRVQRKARRGRRLTCADRALNRKSNRVRARVEHIFGVIKHLWGYRRVRYRGVAKNAAHLFTLFALANWYLVRRDLAGT